MNLTDWQLETVDFSVKDRGLDLAYFKVFEKWCSP